jgi:hypothetical protein
VFHVLAIMQYTIQTESNHAQGVYVTRVLRCLLITNLRSGIYVEEVNSVECFVRFTVKVRVKDLEGSVHQNMRKKC